MTSRHLQAFVLSIATVTISCCSSPWPEEIPELLPIPSEARSSNGPVKLAFVGDVGLGSGFTRMLSLVKSEGADLLVLLGDLAYEEHDPNSPTRFFAELNRVLLNLPVIVIIGNHDVRHWNGMEGKPGYLELYQRRLAQTPELQCVGEQGAKDLGGQSGCRFRGVLIATTSQGTVRSTDSAAHLRRVLSTNGGATFKVCAWHKNQRAMQVGTKPDETGWEIYKVCQELGAMIATGHEHSYSRSRTLTAVGEGGQGHGAMGEPNAVRVFAGHTFVTVSGLGGQSIRPFACSLHDADTWWASLHTSNYTVTNGVSVRAKDCELRSPLPTGEGVLFVEVGEDATGRFVTTDGQTLDSFTIQTKPNP